MPILQKHIEMPLETVEEYGDGMNPSLLQTIYMPDHMSTLKAKLPQPNYDEIRPNVSAPRPGESLKRITRNLKSIKSSRDTLVGASEAKAIASLAAATKGSGTASSNRSSVHVNKDPRENGLRLPPVVHPALRSNYIHPSEGSDTNNRSLQSKYSDS
jgi:hypothetical protein